MDFLESFCGTPEDAGVWREGVENYGLRARFFDEDEEVAAATELPGTPAETAGVRAALFARLSRVPASAPSAAFSFSAAEVRVLKALANPTAPRAQSPGGAEKSSDELYDRLWNSLKSEADGDSADMVMSAFSATPKTRRSPKFRKPPGGAAFAKGRLRSVSKQIMMQNQVKRVLAAGAAGMGSRVSPEKRPALKAALDDVDSWDFDIWAVVDACDGDKRLAAAVVVEVVALDRRSALCKGKAGLLRGFYRNVLDKYQDNPYHGALHGADVLQGTHASLVASSMEDALEEETLLFTMMAAAAHDVARRAETDVGHPGLTNNFLVETGHDLAVRYNDFSPLENMHARVALDQARPILEGLEPAERRRAREVVITLILATDMKEHAKAIFELEHALDKAAADGSSYDACQEQNHLPVLKVLMHLSDVSNPAKPFRTYERWTELVMEEFYAQAEIEEEKDIPHTMPRRGECELGRFQLGFIGFIRPLFAAAGRVEGVDMSAPLGHLDATARVWHDRAENS